MKQLVLAGLTLWLLTACYSYRHLLQSGPYSDVHYAYVIDHGWHTGLLIETVWLAESLPVLQQDFPSVGWLELGWGDSAYYRADDPGAGMAAAAVLWPGSAVLHVVGYEQKPRYTTMLQLPLSRTEMERLAAFLTRTFRADSDGRIRALGKGLYGNSLFYKAHGYYWALNTCNTWIVHALARAGLPLQVTGVVTAGQVMRVLQPLADE